MSELIQSVSLTEFRKLKPHELKELKSCEVTFNGEYLFTFINAQTDYIRVHSEYMAEISNTVGGKTLEEITEAVNASI